MKTVISGVEDLPQDLAVIKTYDQVKEIFPSEGVTTVVVSRPTTCAPAMSPPRSRRSRMR